MYLFVLTFCLPLGLVVSSINQVFECRNLAEEAASRISSQNIVDSSMTAASKLFRPCRENIGGPIEGTECRFCNSFRGILSCYGKAVTHLPDPDQLPPSVDIYQVSNSDVRVIPQKAFFNRTVKEIYIENNKISILSERAFEGVKGAKVISLANNNLPYFMTRMVSELSQLRLLVLDNNGLEFTRGGDLVQPQDKSYFENDDRWGEPNLGRLSLKKLSLRGNPLKLVPREAFTWLNNAGLQELSMRACSIESANQAALVPVSSTLIDLELADVSNVGGALVNLLTGLRNGKLQRLGLSSTGLVSVPLEALQHVAQNLRILVLQGNTLQTITSGDFPLMPRLETLDLRRCSVRVLEDGAFDGLTKLYTLLLAGNRLMTVGSAFRQLSVLNHLDLSNNPDQGFVDDQGFYCLQNNSFAGLNNLSYLDLSNSKLNKLTNVTFDDIKSIQHLSLCNTDLKASPKKNFLHPLVNLNILDFSYNIQLTSMIEPEWFKGLENLHALYITNSELELTRPYIDIFQYLSNLKALNLNDNSLRKIANNTFASLISLQTLTLDRNRIASWDWRIFDYNPQLAEVFLRENQLGFITDCMLEDFANLTYLALQDNPLQCDCNTEKFVNEIGHSNVTHLEDFDSKHQHSYVCTDPDTGRNIKLWKYEDVCPEAQITPAPEISETKFSALISVSVSCACFIVLSLLATFTYRKRHNIKYLALMMKDAMSVALLDDNEETSSSEIIYLYDVFVSYCESDRDWVIQRLLPAVEQESQLRVCLHERDFQPGHGIIDNIIYCIDRSRVLLFVVSKKSLRSQWCQFEMHLAQHRLVETKRDKLILVLTAEIPSSQRSRTLHYLMATRTYLVWDERNEGHFWRRLKRALLLDKKLNVSHA